VNAPLSKTLQIARIVEHERATAIGVERACAVDHRRGHVDPECLAEVAGQGARDASHTAAEVQHPRARHGWYERGQVRDEALGIGHARREEFGGFPRAERAVRSGEHGAERVGATERVPRGRQRPPPRHRA